MNGTIDGIGGGKKIKKRGRRSIDKGGGDMIN
jgi:hypothetical protein